MLVLVEKFAAAMAGASYLISVLGIVSALLWQALLATARPPYNVSFQHRALLIDGRPRILNSAGIHYPRATPEVFAGKLVEPSCTQFQESC